MLASNVMQHRAGHCNDIEEATSNLSTSVVDARTLLRAPALKEYFWFRKALCINFARSRSPAHFGADSPSEASAPALWDCLFSGAVFRNCCKYLARRFEVSGSSFTSEVFRFTRLATAEDKSTAKEKSVYIMPLVWIHEVGLETLSLEF